MNLEQQASTPLFEIDQPEIYGEFMLSRPVEIAAYLCALEKQHAIVTIYLNDGHPFFLSTIVAVDDSEGSIFLDLANSAELRRLTETSPRLTLTATLDKVKIQIRAHHQKITQHDGRAVLSLPLPNSLLRLQRREYFRLETPHASPLHCKLVRQREDGSSLIFNLALLDISGGGLSLMGNTAQSEHFSPGSIFQDCRLEIPGKDLSQSICALRK